MKSVFFCSILAIAAACYVGYQIYKIKKKYIE